MSAAAATTLITDASRLTQRKFFGLITPSEEDIETAANKYQSAALAFKSTKSWSDAVSAYERAAHCFSACKDTHGWITAKKGQIQMLVNNDQQEDAVTLFTTQLLPAVYETGKYDIVVKLVSDVAPTLEATHSDIAIELYRKGIEAARTTTFNSIGTIARLTKQLAVLLASQQKYTESASLLEELTREVADSTDISRLVHKYSAEVVLLTLANGGDIVAAEAKQAELATVDYTLGSDRKWRLARDVIQAFKDINADAFTLAVYQYDIMSPLEPWLVSVLLSIKKEIMRHTSTAEIDIT